MIFFTKKGVYLNAPRIPPGRDRGLVSTEPERLSRYMANELTSCRDSTCEQNVVGRCGAVRLWY